MGRVAHLEVNWWVVHRRLFGQAENEPLVEALTDLYAETYQVEPARVRDAASHRAQAMVFSDRWVNEGRAAGSPLLDEVEAELVRSYPSSTRRELDQAAIAALTEYQKDTRADCGPLHATASPRCASTPVANHGIGGCMSAEAPAPAPTPSRPPRAVLGSVTALAQSAWMGFVLAADVLESLFLAPAGVLRRGRAIVPHIPRHISLRGLLTRELSIAEASFVLMAAFFFSAGLGAVRQVLFNALFGISQEANAYYAAFRLPDTLFSLIAGGALSSAMIPVLLSARREEGEGAGWRLISEVLTVLLVGFAGLILLVEIFTPALVHTVLAPGFDAPTAALTVTLTRIMLIQPLILLLGSVATAVLNSRNQFLLTGLSVLSHNVTLIGGIVLARAVPSLGIFGPTLGVIAGAILQVVILAPGLRGAGGRVRLLWNTADRRLHEVVRLLIPNGLAVSVNYAGFIVDTSFATRAPEQAALAAIYNAFLLVGLPIALLGQAIGQAAFPRLAAQADAGEWAAMRRTVLRTLLIAVSLALPTLAALLLLGRPTIRIIFEHGEFTAAAGQLTFIVLVIYSLGLPAYVASEVVTRGLVSMRDTRTPLFTNTGSLVLRIVLMSLLLARLGAAAIPTAFAAAATLETLTLTAILLHTLGRRTVVSQATPIKSGQQ